MQSFYDIGGIRVKSCELNSILTMAYFRIINFLIKDPTNVTAYLELYKLAQNCKYDVANPQITEILHKEGFLTKYGIDKEILVGVLKLTKFANNDKEIYIISPSFNKYVSATMVVPIPDPYARTLEICKPTDKLVDIPEYGNFFSISNKLHEEYKAETAAVAAQYLGSLLPDHSLVNNDNCLPGDVGCHVDK